MQMIFKNTYVLTIFIGIAVGFTVEMHCMRRLVPLLSRRVYSLPRIPPHVAEKISAVEKEINEQKSLQNQIYRARTQAIFNDIKTVSFYTALYGSCYVPVYGLKSLLVSGGIITALVPCIVASHSFTPFDKRRIQKHTAAIQELEKQRKALFKDHM